MYTLHLERTVECYSMYCTFCDLFLFCTIKVQNLECLWYLLVKTVFMWYKNKRFETEIVCICHGLKKPLNVAQILVLG